MKFILIVSAALALNVGAQVPEGGESDPDIALDPIGRPQAIPGGHKLRKTHDLASLSSFIIDGDRYTIVPKTSVLHVPDARATLLATQPSRQLMGWIEFLSSHRAWIRTFEVTLQQAYGQVPISPEQLELLKQESRIVIATYRGNPISVLPPAKPKEGSVVSSSQP